ncbi:protein of unknown function [Taphrina deformans PYCC 5710]|uniref:Major facilitator superfamily (MFS) profile domain-containing protein n=1 Tax=Taphrina deformans (strain PYCC 5710 / ATCC 11124 / CBS 356.35 / IMI 108563 / JCM 9778 / NBRC 8474) TaxID=1097556 RepID=R4XDI5_TAPDE|nr:protein of unknown function [Taphrina deformans PYCC 5710]|eukprot:CCG83941.1 protein of unknown function [Taphrina deformans PYCC 5710]
MASTRVEIDESQPLIHKKDDEAGARRHLRITICAIALGSFLAAFDQTVVAAIYPTIGASFNALNQTSYLATAYLLSNTALQPLYGRLSDIYGRKNCLLFANTVFLFGTIMCTLSPTLWWCIAGRAVQGIGGGGLNVIGVVILSDLVPVRQRGIYQGIMNIVFGSGSSLGAPIGGILADTIGWRWGFGIQIPLIFISLFMVITFINIQQPGSSNTDTPESRLKRIDFGGSICIVVAVCCLILGFNIGGNMVPWLSVIPICLLSAFVILVITFVVIEAKFAREPIMPMRLMTARTPLLTALINFFSSASYFVLVFNLPLFYRAVMNFSAGMAGKRLIPAALGGSCASLGIGLLMNKTGRYYWVLLTSGVILILSTVLVSTLGADCTVPQQLLYLVPGGFGYAGLLTANLIALLSAIKPEDMAAATGTSYLFRSTGSILGISVSNSVLNTLLTKRLSFLSHGVVEEIKRDINTIWNAAIFTPEERQRVLGTYVDCMHDVFKLAIASALIALLLGTAVEEHKLKTKLVTVEEPDSDEEENDS